MLVDLKYKLDEPGIEIMLGCGAKHLINEIKDAVGNAFREITVTIDHDNDWGICKIVAVNNRQVEDEKYENRPGSIDDL